MIAGWVPQSVRGPLADDDCGADWIWDRDAECAPREDQLATASAAWRALREGLVDRSGFCPRKYAEATFGDAGCKTRLVERKGSSR